MRDPRYTVTVTKGHVTYKVCKIWFGADGSYYVTPPYHPERSAFLMKIRINYARGRQDLMCEDAVDRAGIDDDARALKLSHHPDGFVQYSGAGILSGRGDDGTIRGMGLQSWPLIRPVWGPAFGMTLRPLESYPVVVSPDNERVTFAWDETFPVANADSLVVEGFYFLEDWRRFIQAGHDGTSAIQIVHPSKSVLTLKVLLPAERCALGGFIGVTAYAKAYGIGDPNRPFFAMSGPTGDLRRNLDGELTAESIQCMYPKGERHVDRTLEYLPPDLTDDPGGRSSR